ncbi:Anthranilate synthase component 2 [Rhynchospora pubera]|uniref:anthranilate synthase n=1 Tax=Rhynchospora pubera TaxID=906938 RepID=A0AAV8EGT3_9POAL|nr:Anthranilate synthase component 2 [Rhynchospora pubera]
MAASHLSSAPSKFTIHARSLITLPLPNSNSRSLKKGIVTVRRSRDVKASLSNTNTAPNGTMIADVKRDDKDKPIVVIDNYDSFTYNLCQYMGELGANFEVYRNDELTVEDIRRMNPMGILISPGPGAPRDSGISLQTVVELGPTIPIFGVCMGLQCIGEAYGGKIVRAPTGVVHGKGSLVYYDEKLEPSLFLGLSNPFTAGRYHSLVIENESFPRDALEITAWSEDGLVMAARHKKYNHVQGVQFHPESIISTEGKQIIANFMKFVKELQLRPPQNEN